MQTLRTVLMDKNVLNPDTTVFFGLKDLSRPRLRTQKRTNIPIFLSLTLTLHLLPAQPPPSPQYDHADWRLLTT